MQKQRWPDCRSCVGGCSEIVIMEHTHTHFQLNSAIRRFALLAARWMNLKPWSCNVSGGSEGWHVSSKQQVLHADSTFQHLGRSPMAWCSDCAREAHEGSIMRCHDKLLQESAYISRAQEQCQDCVPHFLQTRQHWLV